MRLLKRKLNSRGFGHIELGLLLIVVIAVSSIGYYVYRSSNAHAANTYTTLKTIKSDGYSFAEQACVTAESGTAPNNSETIAALISVNTEAGPSTVVTSKHHSSGYNPLAYYSISGSKPTTEDNWTSGSTSTITFDLPATLATASFTLGVEGTPGSSATSPGSTQTISSIGLCNPPSTAAPTISLTASPTVISSGSNSTLVWSTTGATGCTASGAWSGSELTAGSYTTPALSTTSNYVLTCSGAGGSTSANMTVTVSALSPPTTACQTLTIPAYFYPTSTNNPWVAASTQAPGSIMIADITTSGPGTSVNSDYTTAIADARAAGDTVFGYVDTAYTSVSLATAEANVAAWKSFYNVTNIFFDEASTTAAQESYYQTLSAYVHTQTAGSLTILNAGAVPTQSYMSAGDIIVTFEGTYSTYQSTSFPSWLSNYPANRFYNIVYDVPTTANMTSVLAQAATDGVQYVYATNQNLPNPYGALPSYLPAELSAAASNCSL